jgi:F-type H+-transporting ATPase subunit b
MRGAAVLALAFGLAVAPGPVRAQESEAEKKTEKAGEAESPLEFWLKWANFALLAGALGYFIGKNAGPFFDTRGKKIRKDMAEAEEARREAEERASAVERRLANLEAEIAAMRAEAQQAGENETQRLEQRAAAEAAKIEAHAQQEIVSAGKAARMELKRYSADLAVELAEQKLRARMTPATQDALVRSFVKTLEDGSSRAQTT